MKGFFDTWELTLTGMQKLPEQEYLETMVRSQIERHPGLREHMAHYERLPR